MDRAIVHNIMHIHDPEDIELMLLYLRTIRVYTSTIHRAKALHDCIFRPRYYYTTCPRTIQLLHACTTKEVTRHVISLNGILPLSAEYLLKIESIVRRVIQSGLYVILDGKIMENEHDVFHGKKIEFIIEGVPFEQEYVSDLDAFHAWLDTRLPHISFIK